MAPESDTPSPTPDEIFRIERPDASLMSYYVLASLVAGPFFLFVLIPLYFRYHTMRYRFSDEGVSMRWGILFRKEINLTFARIQDIHLTSNFVERWLGLARIQIQTASGSAKAEMVIEGILGYEALRDFLYSRMRGAKGLGATAVAQGADVPTGAAPSAEVASILRDAVAELRAIRTAVERRSANGAGGRNHG
ncbi:MAG: PH domain-containing protein [Candidatus Sulfomarinibacteraceae bacterium]